ncbi:hypothetical protein ACFQX6_06000 [Streptosporangium lutulentum]
MPELRPVVALLAGEETTAALRVLVEWLADSRRELVASIVRGAEAAGGPDHALVVRLADLHPEDPACLAPLLLERYELEPGEAIFLGAGVLHCYLSGFGVEIMSGSDNVLRAGLTSKPIEVEELLRVTVPTASPLRVEPVKNVYRTPAPEFGLGSVSPGPGFLLEGGVPRILLCTWGEVEAGGRTLRQGSPLSSPPRPGPSSCADPGRSSGRSPDRSSRQAVRGRHVRRCGSREPHRLTRVGAARRRSPSSLSKVSSVHRTLRSTERGVTREPMSGGSWRAQDQGRDRVFGVRMTR